jgi:hypothetical protein
MTNMGVIRNWRVVWCLIALGGCTVGSYLAFPSPRTVAQTAPAASPAAASEPAPPEGQTYVGTKRCAACHFDQFMKWKKSGHSKAFDALTVKYQKDAKCLKCHTVGYGHETGFKDKATTPDLVAVSCENCHGPGSKHEQVAKTFANVKKLSPEQDKTVRDTIWKLLPKNVCIECHMVQGHHESPTPPEMRKK